jgi:hypothetical protein
VVALCSVQSPDLQDEAGTVVVALTIRVLQTLAMRKQSIPQRVDLQKCRLRFAALPKNLNGHHRPSLIKGLNYLRPSGAPSLLDILLQLGNLLVTFVQKIDLNEPVKIFGVP